MLEAASLWGHALCAALFAALAIGALARNVREAGHRAFAVAAASTALWALACATMRPASAVSGLFESLRTIAWFAFMYVLWRSGQDRNAEQRSLPMVYSVVGLVLAGLLAMNAAPFWADMSVPMAVALIYSTSLVRMIVAIAALLLVHNLYTAATADSRASFRLPIIGLAVMFAYDLNLYTIGYLTHGLSPELMAVRGMVMAAVAAVFALGLAQRRNSRVRLSRSATFQSLGLVAVGFYLTLMVGVSWALQALGGESARGAQVGFVFATSLLALLLLPSARFRAWFRVTIAKHLFQHRYDYRAEWLRFTETIGQPDDAAAPLETRIVKALGDIAESPSGLLLVRDDNGSLILQTAWNREPQGIPATAVGKDAAQFFAETGRIIELDTIRAPQAGQSREASLIPEWLLADSNAWAMVPLVHFGRLAGMVVLDRPLVDRTFDWEDFDLLKVVGRQVASYLAEARGQEALAHVEQFDEFNRRFAFIMHDIKNLVSQLSLVTRNAERHADNPEFRADMIATLTNSTARMNELLARLSQHNRARAEDPRPESIGPLVERIAASKRNFHPIVIGGDLAVFAIIDPARFEQALTHLVQNAIDASPEAEPVCITVRQIGGEVAIDVEDKGSGMSGHFIRHNLFKPFSSTKDGGFGIGAYEARELVTAMNGSIEVSSQEGEGSRFRILLPLSRDPVVLPSIIQQKRVA